MRTAAAGVEYTPIFDWSAPRSRKISLLSFIAASAVLHLLCFYIFQIIYPPTVALLPPPARVNIITPASEEGRVLLRWVEAEDPALSSITQRSPDAPNFSPPKPEHVPSYLTRQPALRELPPSQPNLSVPSSRPPAPVPFDYGATQVVAPPVSTELKFSDDLATLGTPKFPAAHFNTSSKEPPQAAQFWVGVNGRGEIRHCLLADSSGDSALDEQARRQLLLCRFSTTEKQDSKTENGLLWGTATIEWGNDIVIPSPASAQPPPP